MTVPELDGNWMTFRCPLRHIFKIFSGDTIFQGVQMDVRIWLRDDHDYLDGTQYAGGPTVMSATDKVELQTVYLDVPQITSPLPLPLSSGFALQIPDQYEVLRHEIPASSAKTLSLFLHNTLDDVRRATFHMVDAKFDYGGSHFLTGAPGWERTRSAMHDFHLENLKLFVTQRQQPKHDLVGDEPNAATDPTSYRIQPGEGKGADRGVFYNLYLKRCGALLQNPQGDLDETSATLSLEDFTHFYPHVTIDVAEVENPTVMKQLNVGLTFGIPLNDAAQLGPTGTLVLYTVLHKVQNVAVQLKNQSAIVQVSG